MNLFGFEFAHGSAAENGFNYQRAVRSVCNNDKELQNIRAPQSVVDHGYIVALLGFDFV